MQYGALEFPCQFLELCLRHGVRTVAVQGVERGEQAGAHRRAHALVGNLGERIHNPGFHLVGGLIGESDGKDGAEAGGDARLVTRDGELEVLFHKIERLARARSCLADYKGFPLIFDAVHGCRIWMQRYIFFFTYVFFCIFAIYK